MPDNPGPQGWWHTVPGLLTGLAALLTALTGIYLAWKRSEPAAAPPPAAVAPVRQTAPAAAPADARETERPVRAVSPPDTAATPAVAGRWRDNWGNLSMVIQAGSTFQFQTIGVSCNGRQFRSSGAGTVSGFAIQSTYQSSLPSQGSCSGQVSADGRQMTSTCTDSVCGTFVATSTREH